MCRPGEALLIRWPSILGPRIEIVDITCIRGEGRPLVGRFSFLCRRRPHADGSDIYTRDRPGMLRVVLRLSGGLLPHGRCDLPALIVGCIELRHILSG